MGSMENPFCESAVYAASWPHHIDNDGKQYFIFQTLTDSDMAGPVFYRDMALPGSEKIMITVAKAYMDRKKLKVFLIDPSAGSMLVNYVELGSPIPK